MVYTNNDKKELQIEVCRFIKNICEKKDWQNDEIAKIFASGLKYKLYEKKRDCTKCIANVCNGNEVRQCSRKKKFGDFCGLHVKIKSNLKSGTINSIASSNKEDIIFLNFKNENPKLDTNNSFSDNNTFIELDDCFVSQHEYYDLYWKGVKYLIDENNSVYFDDYDELILIGHLENGLIVGY